MTRHQRLIRRRLWAGLIVIVAVFTIFGARLFQIQGIDSQAYATMAAESGTQTIAVPAPRGKIVDRNDVALAANTAGMTLTADPSMTRENATEIARVLVDVFGDEIDYFDAVTKLRTPKSRFEYLIKKAPAWKAQDALDRIKEAGYVGVFGQKVSLRSYPGGTLAANLLGHLNDAGDGVGGLEQRYNSVLTGVDGSQTFEVSPTGQRIPQAENTVKEMQPGGTVVTTIDRDLQWYADRRLAEAVKSASADWGLAITMDTQTGQIVQMSQAPTFNPDTGANQNKSTTVSRAYQTVYEPGSVQKSLTMAALADRGKIRPDSKIVVPPSMTIDGFKISDYWKHGVLHLTAAGAIAQSSNLGVVVAAQALSDQQMHDALNRFGLGDKTGIDLPGESAGLLPPASDWSDAKHATIAFGQGISVTAIQMLRAVGAIANNGVMVEPTVVSATRTPQDGTSKVKTSKKRVMSEQASSSVTRMMEAVTAKNGTAHTAAIKGYRVAGKTGTAWRVNPDTGRYVKGQNTVSFIGFAPADNPRFITYVVLDKPHSNAGGGSTAGPVFSDIMSMALERFGIPPTGSKPPKVPHKW